MGAAHISRSICSHVQLSSFGCSGYFVDPHINLPADSSFSHFAASQQLCLEQECIFHLSAEFTRGEFRELPMPVNFPGCSSGVATFKWKPKAELVFSCFANWLSAMAGIYCFCAGPWFLGLSVILCCSNETWEYHALLGIRQQLGKGASVTKQISHLQEQGNCWTVACLLSSM